MNKLVQQRRRFRVIYQFPTLGPRTYVHRVKTSFFWNRSPFFDGRKRRLITNRRRLPPRNAIQFKIPKRFGLQWPLYVFVPCRAPYHYNDTGRPTPFRSPIIQIQDQKRICLIPLLSLPHLGVLWKRILVLSFFFCINIFFSFEKCIYVHSSFKIYLAVALAYSFCLSWNELLAPIWA